MKHLLLLSASLLPAALATAAAASAAPAGVPFRPGGADTAPPVEEIVTLALSQSPSLAALHERLLAAQELIAPAGALPDPIVEVTLQDVGFPRWTVGSEDMSMVGAGVRQDFPYPGKRAARRAAAQAEAVVRAAELEQLRREIAVDVRRDYARIWALDNENELLTAAREMLEMLQATVTGRYAVGEAEQEAVLKAQLETSRVAERLDDLAAERLRLVAALNQLLDLPGDAPLGRVGALPRATTPPLPWGELAMRGAAAVAVKQAEVAAAQRRLEVARISLKPNISAGAAAGLRGGFDSVVTLSLGLELPLWRKQKQEPEIHAAEHELAMAQADLRDSLAEARAAAARLAAEWQRAEKQIQRYQQAIVPQTSAAIDAARASYLAGRGDFLTVVDDFNRWLAARVQLASREADRFATWAELEALIASPTGSQTGKEN